MKPTVLVVDDDRAIRQMMREVLEEEGYPVQTAEHGGVALERLHASAAPLLVLLGLCMPVVTAEQVLEAVAAYPTLAARHRMVPVAGVRDWARTRGRSWLYRHARALGRPGVWAAGAGRLPQRLPTQTLCA